MSPAGTLANGPPPAARVFPYPDIPGHDREIIEAAIAVAWSRLSERYRLREFNEVQLNELMRMELNDLLDEDPSPVPAYTSERFETVERDSEFADHTGQRLGKKPDLRFRYVGRKRPGVLRREQHALFVECKIVDSTDGTHHMKFYTETGLIKFVRGDYAWAMPSAMMIGYVRDGSSSVPVELTGHLRDCKSRRACRVRALPTKCTIGQAYESRHRRRFKVENISPGDIVIVHVWLPMR